MNRAARVRRHRNPNQQNENEKKTPFFSKESNPPFFSAGVQAKLSIGQPGDIYEKEADAMADAVVKNPNPKPAIQNKEISGIQRETIATPVEDEKLGTNDARMRKDKEIQEKPEVQRLCPGCEKEKEGMGGALQTKDGGENAASPQLASKIESAAGKGSTLPKNTLSEMNSSFGVDFSNVNVHTGTDAVQMNKELGAQAFTHGSDIYFNSGKYNPESSGGKQLLAHELTHVLQQNGPNRIQALGCDNTGNDVSRTGQDQRNGLDVRAQRIIDFAQDSSVPIDQRGVGIVTRIICYYFPEESQKVFDIQYNASLSGLDTTSHGRGAATTGIIGVGSNFVSGTSQRHFARRVLQVFHELTHIEQYRQGLAGHDKSDQREFLAFYEEALGNEFEGTGRMQYGTRLSLIDGALGYYNCLSEELRTQYQERRTRLLERRRVLTSSSRISESSRSSTPPTTCTRS